MTAPWGWLGELAFPAVCLACRVAEPLAGGRVCRACAQELRPFWGPWCQGCGGFLDTALDHCRECLQADRPWRQAVSVMPFTGLGRVLIHRFKYRGDVALTPLFADWLDAAWRQRRAGRRPTLLVPVPMHPLKQWRRGYNQSALLAHELAPRWSMELLPALTRPRWTPAQMRLDRRERQANLKNAFQWRPGYQVARQGVLLLDDVLTTGATLAAASQVLLRAGAAFVDVVTLARGQ